MDKFFYPYYLKPSINETWACAANVFSKEECYQIKKLSLNLPSEKALVFEIDPTFSNENIEVRKGKVRWIPNTSGDYIWIYERCTEVIMSLNEKFWKFDIDFLESIQFTEYIETGDYYGKHLDMEDFSGRTNRKLSFSILLDDPSSYEGADLVIHNNNKGTVVPREQGSLIAFPSYILHEVTPIVSGVRNSLVGWISGPNFR